MLGLTPTPPTRFLYFIITRPTQGLIPAWVLFCLPIVVLLPQPSGDRHEWGTVKKVEQN